MAGKTAVITGANRGVGRGIALRLAERGFRIVMACRDLRASRPALDRIKDETGNDAVDLMELDLASFRSIRSFANTFLEKVGSADILINNAGVLCRDFHETEDGLELSFGVNYAGPFLLTRLILPSMLRREGARIINTSSVLYRFGRVDASLFEGGRRFGSGKYHGFRHYSDSKLAVILFSLELAGLLENEGIPVNTVDPGIVDTNMITMHRWYDPLTDILFRPFLKNENEGAATSVMLAVSENLSGVSGRYFVNKTEHKLPRWVAGHPYRKALWEKTERLLGLPGLQEFPDSRKARISSSISSGVDAEETTRAVP